MSLTRDLPGTQGEPCLVRSVADTFTAEPALEAVTIDAAHEKISIATLGRADVEALTREITGKIRSIRNAPARRACGLLDSQAGCGECATLLSLTEQRGLTVQQQGEVTTIARVT